MPIYSFTGNPFVDTGIGVIMVYCNRKKPEDISLEDIKKVSELLQDIYFQGNWGKCLFSVFPNNPITNPSFKTIEKKKEKWKEVLDSLASDIEEEQLEGSCMGCGRRANRKQFSKTYVPLTGSTALRNFFSYAGEGADYCSACIFAIQASPLAYYMCGKLMLLHSSNPSIMVSWAKICNSERMKQKVLGSTSGCYNDGYTNPINAIFHLTNILLDEYESEMEDGTEIAVYHFTNYNQGPEIDIYRVPGKIFTFIKHMHQQKYSSYWNSIVRKGYHIENFKKVDPDNEDTYKNYRNTVYDNLMKGRSILKYFFQKGERQVIGNFEMLSWYLREVEGMEKKRLEVIKKVADRIADHIKETDNLKRLTKLERANTAYEIRNQLRLITKERLKLEKNEPLFTIDEYVEYLFPNGEWRETQDIILFRIYERLFEWFKEKNVDELINEIEEDK